MKSVGRALVATIALGLGCHRASERASPADDDDELAVGVRYLDDASFRRSALEASLVNPKNTYSRQRLASYALSGRGWDLLPVWNPRSAAMTESALRELAEGRMPELPADTKPLWNGTRPSSLAEWRELGREVFFRYPLREEPVVGWALARRALAEEHGVRVAPDGTVPGLVLFGDVDGQTRIGVTCAMCHTNVRDGRVVVGEARRAFDYGALRLAYHDATGIPVDDGFARRLRSWGPGRADVTEDDDEDPVAIPDLWGLRDQTFLTQAGTIKKTSIAALAIRQETQLLTAHGQDVRPPRELAFALAAAVHAFEPPPNEATASEVTRAGESLFRTHCSSCHSNAAKGGEPVAVDRVDTDHALANGTARGTGTYRPPSLVRVANAAPYFHDGSVAKLEDVISPERLAPTFTGGFLGPGPVRGHRFGTDLAKEEREAIVAYLRTL